MSNNRLPGIQKLSDVTIVALGPEYENLDEHLLDELRGPLLEASKAADPPLFVIDLSHTKFFGSSFIELLFRIWNRMKAQEGGKFGISGLTAYCREILEVTHLDKLWEIYDSTDDAVRSLSGQ